MGPIDERLSARFRRWEMRTRGWAVFSRPVAPEPPFAPFGGGDPPLPPDFDDGRKPGIFSRLIGRRASAPVPEPPDDEPEPATLERAEPVELPLFLPPSFTAKPDALAQFFSSLSICAEPVSFEVLGTPQHITAQLAASATDEPHLRRQLRAFFPDLVTSPVSGGLTGAWAAAGEAETAFVEFGLDRECHQPLATVRHDLCVALAGALGELREGELGLFQVMFQSAANPWLEPLLRSVTDATGKGVFVNAPELADGVRQKISRPLFGVVVRIAARSPDFDRAWDIARQLAVALRAFAVPNGNELIPLRNDGYPWEAHAEDVLRRQSRRCGMLLNSDELLGFASFPTAAVHAPKFRRQTRKTKSAPDFVTQGDGCFIGWNEHLGNKRGVWLTNEQRVRHVHVIGASGTGKSTLLARMIAQDIEAGEGVGVVDPHGDLVDQILGIIPPERVGDVVLLDPSDEQFAVGFNILSAHSDLEKNLLASDLVSVFRRLSTSWGDQMGSVLQNAILAFLESPRGGTLADVRRFLLEPGFREEFLKTVADAEVVYYWRKAFPQLGGNKSVGPILTRLETFLSQKPVRLMVAQRENKLDFADIMDGGKIFLAKLSQGAIGRENAHLLGSLIVAKLHQTAMSRQRQQAAARKDFWLYLDEFQDFITASMGEILAGARKYRLGLTLAHQELRALQREPEVASAVIANAGTRICFRLGDQDARALESGFSSFEARDLQSLDTGEAVCRAGRSDYDFNLTVPPSEPVDETEAAERRHEVITRSREKYATPRAEVEAALRAAMEPEPVSVKARTEPPRATPEPSAPATPKPATPEKLPPPPEPVAKPTPTVAPTPVAPAPAPKPAPVASEPGKGGHQHKTIQKRMKAEAEQWGFRVSLEKEIPGSAGSSVDAVFERGPFLLACEITVTTTVDHEVGNVRKCLDAGYPHVAVVAVTEAKLAQLAAAVSRSLGADAAARVGYFLPDGLLAHLRAMPLPEPAAPPEPKTKTVRGIKVKTSYAPLSPEQAAARDAAMIQLIADEMKPPARKPRGG
jgi:hypothetical protein